jgi:hypothetical protein
MFLLNIPFIITNKHKEGIVISERQKQKIFEKRQQALFISNIEDFLNTYSCRREALEAVFPDVNLEKLSSLSFEILERMDSLIETLVPSVEDDLFCYQEEQVGSIGVAIL